MGRMLRRVAALLLPALLLSPTPASAAAQGAGAYAGGVTFSPGITAFPTVNNFSFGSTLTVGTFTLTDAWLNTATYTGFIDVVAGGVGTEAYAAGSGIFLTLTAGGGNGLATLTASLAPPVLPIDNTYARVGAAAIIVLRLDITITQGPTTVTAPVRLLKQGTLFPSQTTVVTSGTINGPFSAGPG